MEDWVLDNEVNRLNVDGRMMYFYELFIGCGYRSDDSPTRGEDREGNWHEGIGAFLGDPHAVKIAPTLRPRAEGTGLEFFGRQVAASAPLVSDFEAESVRQNEASVALMARCWFARLVDAELKLAREQSLSAPLLISFIRAFGALVEAEALRRLSVSGQADTRVHPGAYGRLITDLARRQNDLIALVCNPSLPPFCREILATWNPLWRRYSFVLYSPFDNLRKLAYSVERAQALHASFEQRIVNAGRGTVAQVLESAPSKMASAQPRSDRKLIAIEGIDGAGKTTIRYALYEALRKSGEPAFIVGQRGWLDLDDTRTIVDFREGRRGHSVAEICGARFRDKQSLVAKSVVPALRTHHVVADRFTVSDAVYDEALLGVPAEATMQRHQANGTREPDIVVFLDLDPQTAVARIGSRAGNLQSHENAKDLKRLSEVYRRVFSERRVRAGKHVLHFSDNLKADADAVAPMVIEAVKRCIQLG